jgi:type IV pilus assembly protein PilM
MRDVSLGCSQIHQKIAAIANCTLAEAEAISLSQKAQKISAEELKSITSASVSDWCDEIRRALDFFYSTNPEDQIKQIYLSGGAAGIKEFRDLLALQSSINVKPINPFERIEINGDQLDSAYMKQIAPQAAISMGLAIRKVDDK